MKKIAARDVVTTTAALAGIALGDGRLAVRRAEKATEETMTIAAESEENVQRLPTMIDADADIDPRTNVDTDAIATAILTTIKNAPRDDAGHHPGLDRHLDAHAVLPRGRSHGPRSHFHLSRMRTKSSERERETHHRQTKKSPTLVTQADSRLRATQSV